MNKFLLGIVVGVTAAYAVKKLQDKGYFNEIENELNDCVSKTKKTAKNMWDQAENEAEYLKDRAKYAAKKGKDALNELSY